MAPARCGAFADKRRIVGLATKVARETRATKRGVQVLGFWRTRFSRSGGRRRVEGRTGRSGFHGLAGRTMMVPESELLIALHHRLLLTVVGLRSFRSF